MQSEQAWSMLLSHTQLGEKHREFLNVLYVDSKWRANSKICHCYIDDVEIPTLRAQLPISVKNLHRFPQFPGQLLIAKCQVEKYLKKTKKRRECDAASLSPTQALFALANAYHIAGFDLRLCNFLIGEKMQMWREDGYDKQMLAWFKCDIERENSEGILDVSRNVSCSLGIPTALSVNARTAIQAVSLERVKKATDNPDNWCVMVAFNPASVRKNVQSMNFKVMGEWGNRQSSSDVLLVYGVDKEQANTFYLLCAIHASEKRKEFMPNRDAWLTSDVLQNATFVHRPADAKARHHCQRMRTFRPPQLRKPNYVRCSDRFKVLIDDDKNVLRTDLPKASDAKVTVDIYRRRLPDLLPALFCTVEHDTTQKKINIPDMEMTLSTNDAIDQFQIVCAIKDLMILCLGQDKYWNNPLARECYSRDIYDSVSLTEWEMMEECFSSPTRSTWKRVENNCYDLAHQASTHLYRDEDKSMIYNGSTTGFVLMQPSQYGGTMMDVLYAFNLWNRTSNMCIFLKLPDSEGPPRLWTILDRSHGILFTRVYNAAHQLTGRCEALNTVPDRKRGDYSQCIDSTIHRLCNPELSMSIDCNPNVKFEDCVAALKYPQMKLHYYWGWLCPFQRTATIYSIYQSYACGILDEEPVLASVRDKLEIANCDPTHRTLLSIRRMVEEEYTRDELTWWSALIELRDEPEDYLREPVRVILTAGNIDKSRYLCCFVKSPCNSRPLIVAHLDKSPGLQKDAQRGLCLDVEYFRQAMSRGTFFVNALYNVCPFSRGVLLNQFELCVVLASVLEDRGYACLNVIDRFERMKQHLPRYLAPMFQCPSTIESVKDWCRSRQFESFLSDVMLPSTGI